MSPSLVYYIDASDTGTSTNFFMQNWADDAGMLDDDIKMDINPVDGDMDLNFIYTYSTALLHLSSFGDHSGEWFNGHSDANVHLTVEKVIQNHSRTIVVNGTGDNSYGLDKVGNSYRYSADDQVYVLLLNCSGSDSTFVSGVNTIILPRSIAVNSQLNQSLSNPASISSGNPLQGATFAYTHASAATSSGHLVAVISQSLTVQGAESLLSMLTHGPANVVVGQGTVIDDPNMLYLMHLPKDILSAIPIVNTQGSALGGDVNYLSITHYIVGIAEFVYNGLVAGANVLVNFAKVMFDLGLAVVNGLGQVGGSILSSIQFTKCVMFQWRNLVFWKLEYYLFLCSLGAFGSCYNCSISCREEVLEKQLMPIVTFHYRKGLLSN
jgi:hypothetical protein